jgi:hypothetical protein
MGKVLVKLGRMGKNFGINLKNSLPMGREWNLPAYGSR